VSTRFGRAEPNGRCFTRRLGLFGIALSAALLLVSLAPSGVLAESPSVRVIYLEGEINAVTAGYVSAAVAKAAS
jgi:membrane-bound ClpP family serine protease